MLAIKIIDERDGNESCAGGFRGFILGNVTSVMRCGVDSISLVA